MPTINGLWRPVRSFPFGPLTANLDAFGRGTLLLGCSLIETTGAATAELVIRDGNDANGAPVAFFSLLAAQSIRDNFGSEGVYCEAGPFLNIVAGSVQGALWYLDITAAELGQRANSEP